MSQPYEYAPELTLIAGIAGAIRREVGDAVEACPGHRTPEQAEPLNRAFRAIVRHVLGACVASGHDLAGEVTRVLHRVARDRLEAGGLGERQVRALLEFEPGTPDDWAVFLALIPWHEVLFWLGTGDQDPA
jgi:hypothetical protein